MKRNLFSIFVLLLIMATAMGPARAQNTQTRTLTGIPQGWTVTADGQSVTATADGSYTIAAGAAVKLIPPTEVKPTVQNVTVERRNPLTVPLTLEALTYGTIQVNINGTLTTGMKYSVNGGQKTTITTTENITVAAGDRVQFYGNGTSTTVYGNSPRLVKLQGSGSGFQTKVYGNIMSLVNEEGYDTATTLSGNKVFASLFLHDTTLTDASGLLLPATTLAQNCYNSMFQGCTALTAAPAELPATELAPRCYYFMFNNCTSLTTAPELPATELDSSCYYHMFDKCTSLTAAPELPATELVYSCYSYMFHNCSSLSSVTCLATSGINQDFSTNNWLYGVAATGTFTKAANVIWDAGTNGIPSGWNVVEAQ